MEGRTGGEEPPQGLLLAHQALVATKERLQEEDAWARVLTGEERGLIGRAISASAPSEQGPKG